MECWSNGLLELWSPGFLFNFLNDECQPYFNSHCKLSKGHLTYFALLHYSNTPGLLSTEFQFIFDGPLSGQLS